MRVSLLNRVENGHDDAVWGISWAPQSGTLATGSVDESVKIWSESNGTLEQVHQLVRGRGGLWLDGCVYGWMHVWTGDGHDACSRGRPTGLSGQGKRCAIRL